MTFVLPCKQPFRKQSLLFHTGRHQGSEVCHCPTLLCIWALDKTCQLFSRSISQITEKRGYMYMSRVKVYSVWVRNHALLFIREIEPWEALGFSITLTFPFCSKFLNDILHHQTVSRIDSVIPIKMTYTLIGTRIWVYRNTFNIHSISW